MVIPPLESIEIINRKKPKAGEQAFFGLESVAPMPSIGDGFNVAVTSSTHDEHGLGLPPTQWCTDGLLRQLITR